MHFVGVLDRTGEIAQLLEDLSSRLDGDLKVVVLDHRRPIPSDLVLNFLVVGPREGSGAALRRVRRYLDRHPATLTVASGISAKSVDRTTLLASGIRHVSRTRPTSKQLVKLLASAMEDLDLLSRSIEPIVEEVEPPVDIELFDEEPPDDEFEFVAEEELPPVEEELFAVEEEPVTQESGEFVDEPAEVLELEEMVEEEAEPEPRLAQLITVASATGGCGKTFFSTNLALLVAKSGRRCLIVDLDLQFGEVAIALRVSHPYSVYDGLYDADGRRLPSEALHDHLQELTYHHSLGFDVLTAPRDPSLADYVGARDADEILAAVLPLYDVVIVDTPPSLNEVVLVALDRSDVVAIMATLDVPSLKNLAVFLDTLHRLSIEDSHVRLILNKTESDVGMKVSQAQDAFNDRFIAAIPASRAVSRSINAGTVVTATEPRSQVSRRTHQAAAALLPGLIDPLDSSHGSRWRRWFHKGVPVTTAEQGS